ncbi:hypothetical protein NW762_005168 [Fusarium torreyae]|uniref:Uncharacterized protein n=1 Tax=Fusarium torreyae TaxID=1237075 RepID=A0A9W8S482_9HYPO|nr:hypothetical protein NW762_005168 [Fusarium torreyae]
MAEPNSPSASGAAAEEPNSIEMPNLSTADVLKIHKQMVGEIFNLAGKKRREHPECYAACVLKLQNTNVIRATEFAIWFNYANKVARSHNFYMIPATIAVTIAAVLNQKQTNVDPGGIPSVMNLFSKSSVWAYLGTAIEVWPRLKGARFLVKQADNRLERPTPGKTSGGRVCVHTNELDRVTPLMLLSTARINGWTTPVPGASWLKKGSDDCEQIIHRHKALEDGRKVIEKLGNRNFKQDDKIFVRAMKAWLSEPVIRILPEDIKNRCSQYDKDWLPTISASGEDLNKWRYKGEIEGPVASLMSHDIDWQDLAQKVQDRKSTKAIKTVVEFAETARAIRQSQKSYIAKVVSDLEEVRKTLFEQRSDCLSLKRVFGSALNQCFLNQETDGRRNILVGALQRLFDNIVYVVPENHALCRASIDMASIDMASKVDGTITQCIDFEVARAKVRHEQRLKSNHELTWRNERVDDIAKEVDSLEPGAASPDLILRSRINLILDLADATVILESLPR